MYEEWESAVKSLKGPKADVFKSVNKAVAIDKCLKEYDKTWSLTIKVHKGFCAVHDVVVKRRTGLLGEVEKVKKDIAKLAKKLDKGSRGQEKEAMTSANKLHAFILSTGVLSNRRFNDDSVDRKPGHNINIFEDKWKAIVKLKMPPLIKEAVREHDSQIKISLKQLKTSELAWNKTDLDHRNNLFTLRPIEHQFDSSYKKMKSALDLLGKKNPDMEPEAKRLRKSLDSIHATMHSRNI